MPRLCCAALLIASTAAIAAETSATADTPSFGFDVGLEAYQPISRSLDQGYGWFLALRFPIRGLQAGFRYERIEVHSLDDDNNTGLADDAKYDIDLHELLLEHPLWQDLNVGMSAGIARVRASIAINGDGGPVGVLAREQSPTGDLYLSYRLLRGGQRLDAALSLVTGYRFLWFRQIDPDTSIGTDYESPISNFSGFHLGLAVGARF